MPPPCADLASHGLGFAGPKAGGLHFTGHGEHRGTQGPGSFLPVPHQSLQRLARPRRMLPSALTPHPLGKRSVLGGYSKTAPCEPLRAPLRRRGPVYTSGKASGPAVSLVEVGRRFVLFDVGLREYFAISEFNAHMAVVPGRGWSALEGTLGGVWRRFGCRRWGCGQAAGVQWT